jgi:hypothetical protein
MYREHTPSSLTRAVCERTEQAHGALQSADHLQTTVWERRREPCAATATSSSLSEPYKGPEVAGA